MNWCLRTLEGLLTFISIMISVDFVDLPPIRDLRKRDLKNEVNVLVEHEGFKCGDVSVLYCTDEYLLDINRKYLNHDYYTDIITFDYSEGEFVSGDLMISWDRVKDNAIIENVHPLNELFRVSYHGVLHLCGYKDKEAKDKEVMTQKENFYLKKFKK